MPVRVLLLHGWSPGPGLPGLLTRGGLFDVQALDAATVCTIVRPSSPCCCPKPPPRSTTNPHCHTPQASNPAALAIWGVGLLGLAAALWLAWWAALAIGLALLFVAHLLKHR